MLIHAGSRFEDADTHGHAHFLERFAFKVSLKECALHEFLMLLSLCSRRRRRLLLQFHRHWNNLGAMVCPVSCILCNLWSLCAQKWDRLCVFGLFYLKHIFLDTQSQRARKDRDAPSSAIVSGVLTKKRHDFPTLHPPPHPLSTLSAQACRSVQRWEEVLVFYGSMSETPTTFLGRCMPDINILAMSMCELPLCGFSKSWFMYLGEMLCRVVSKQDPCLAEPTESYLLVAAAETQ